MSLSADKSKKKFYLYIFNLQIWYDISICFILKFTPVRFVCLPNILLPSLLGASETYAITVSVLGRLRYLHYIFAVIYGTPVTTKYNDINHLTLISSVYFISAVSMNHYVRSHSTLYLLNKALYSKHNVFLRFKHLLSLPQRSFLHIKEFLANMLALY